MPQFDMARPQAPEMPKMEITAPQAPEKPQMEVAMPERPVMPQMGYAPMPRPAAPEPVGRHARAQPCIKPPPSTARGREERSGRYGILSGTTAGTRLWHSHWRNGCLGPRSSARRSKIAQWIASGGGTPMASAARSSHRTNAMGNNCAHTLGMHLRVLTATSLCCRT